MNSKGREVENECVLAYLLFPPEMFPNTGLGWPHARARPRFGSST